MSSTLTTLVLIISSVFSVNAAADAMMVDCKVLQFAKSQKALTCRSTKGPASHRSMEVFSMGPQNKSGGVKVLLRVEKNGVKSCALAILAKSSEFQAELTQAKSVNFPLSASSKLSLGHAGVTQVGSESILGAPVSGDFHCKI